MNNIDKIKFARRIAIIGNAGSGKSTLAQKLHEKLGLPLYHLDQYFWGPNGERPDSAAYKKVHDELCDRNSWIMDGVNLRVIEYRIARADVVIFLDIPTATCLWRVAKRSCKYHFGNNQKSSDGCSQKLGWNFLVLLHWIVNFKNKYILRLQELFQKYEHDTIVIALRSVQEVDEFAQEVARLR